jgi:hypothetical protein
MATIERRQTSDGTRYRVRIRIKGEKPRTRTFKRKTDAKAWAQKAESDLGHGIYVPTTADRRRTLGELIDKYVKEHLPTTRGADSKKFAAQLNWWKDNAGHLTLDKVTPEAIAGYRSELLSGDQLPLDLQDFEFASGKLDFLPAFDPSLPNLLSNFVAPRTANLYRPYPSSNFLPRRIGGQLHKVIKIK